MPQVLSRKARTMLRWRPRARATNEGPDGTHHRALVALEDADAAAEHGGLPHQPQQRQAQGRMAGAASRPSGPLVAVTHLIASP